MLELDYKVFLHRPLGNKQEREGGYLERKCLVCGVTSVSTRLESSEDAEVCFPIAFISTRVQSPLSKRLSQSLPWATPHITWINSVM